MRCRAASSRVRSTSACVAVIASSASATCACCAAFRALRFSIGGLSAEKIRLGLRHPGPIIIVLDLDQHLALLDALKIIHGDATHIALDLRAQRRDVAADIGVIRDLPHCQADPAVPLSSEQDDDNPGGDQNGEPDKRDPRPWPSSRPRHFRRRSLCGGGRCQSGFAIGG